MSKVPIGANTQIKNTNPAPVAYNVSKSIGANSTMNSTLGDSKFEGSQGGRPNSNGFFLSTTARGDFWKNDPSAPFTQQTYMQNPGPDKYPVEKKKGDDIKSRLLQEETV